MQESAIEVVLELFQITWSSHACMIRCQKVCQGSRCPEFVVPPARLVCLALTSTNTVKIPA